MTIEFRNELPDNAEFFKLFETTGWNNEYRASEEELARMLANSQQVIAAYEDEKLVGVGRVVSDGVLHAMIYDMIVDPDYRGQGIGTQILRELVDWCLSQHIRDIQLFCAKGKMDFYAKNGFAARPEDAPGMQYVHREKKG